ncbi:MAG: hypothetical protein LBF54_03455 [Holosporaceae bacterium]|jgi:hypothetical protein|nr:hypothetical protein [Holosporaceae bacterium]
MPQDEPYILELIGAALMVNDESMLNYWEQTRGFTRWREDPAMRTYLMISGLRKIDTYMDNYMKTDNTVNIMTGNPDVAITFFDRFFSNATLDEVRYFLDKSLELHGEAHQISQYWQARLERLQMPE